MFSQYTPTIAPAQSRKIQSRRRWPTSPYRPTTPYRRAIYRRRIRRFAAVNFKIYLKTGCSPALVSYVNPLISLKIRSQRRSKALSVVGQQHFSGELPILLPGIAARLHKLCTEDYASINELLASVSSLFMKYRNTLFNGNDLPLDVKYCLDTFGKPLSDLFIRTASLIDKMAESGAAIAPILKLYIESQWLCCCIFHSLNFHEVPEFFKDHMNVWMVEFKKYIALNFPVVDELELADLRAAICENISLYVIKEEELFQQGYLSGFVESVLSRLVSPSSHGSKQMIVSAIKFLTAVSKSRHHFLLSSDVILHQIYQSIIIPTVMLHDVDEELFEMNPVEFIRKDMEGNNMDTITRISCELLKGIATHYKDKVTQVVELQTYRCASRFKGNRKGNWKYMYCALYLVISLATENAVGTSVSTDIVDFKNFSCIFILYEFDNEDVTSFPMVKAMSMKFFILFRNQILKKYALYALPCVIRLLTSPNYVVHSCAAKFIEELLLVKDERVTLPHKFEEFLLHEDDSERCRRLSRYERVFSKAGYTSKDICPILSTMMSNLFSALNNHESEENPYVMKCIMRVVLVGDLTADIASLCIERLATILHKVCQNPKIPTVFNDYLFESLIGLVRRVCFLLKETKGRPRKEEISLVSLLEKKLYPVLQMILAKDINEFFTYAFRLLAELVYLNIPLLPVEYSSQVFDILRLPDTWMSQAKGFLPHQLSFPSVIYSKLVSSSAIDDQGYYALNIVIENLGFEEVSPFVGHLWVSLFNRLRNKRTKKSVKNIIVFMSLFLLKDGPKNLVSSVNATFHPNGFQGILEQFWIPNLKLITNPIELKLTSVASTRLICESPDIFDIKLWGKMLDNIITLVSRPEIPQLGETIDYSPPLYNNAGKKEELEEALKEIEDPRQFLVASLSNLFAGQRNKYDPQAMLSENLEEANQSALLQLFNLYNVCIV